MGTVGRSYHRFKDNALKGNLLYEARHEDGVNPFNVKHWEDASYKKKYLAIESYLAIFSPVIAGVIIDRFHLNFVLVIFPGIMFFGSFI